MQKVNFPKVRLSFHEAIRMSIKAARGTKRVCQSCGSKFYDLNRTPITCPICQVVFQQQEIRGGKAAPAGNAVEDDDDDLLVSPAGASDIVSLDEAGESDLPDLEDNDLVEIEDDDADLKGDDETFIEVEDDDGGDVSGMVGGARENDDEV
jgi:uncharacterized protein (TIGR02300 family)